MITGKAIFEELGKFIKIPPYCKSLVLRVGLDEPVILETVCYVEMQDVHQRFELLEIKDDE